MANWIGGYEQLTEMKTAGSGSARWCIAKRYGQRFFVKEFLSPVYPGEEKKSQLAKKQRKRCVAFEEKKQRLYSAMSCVLGDSLVPVVDFFRCEGRYYAVSEEVQPPYVTGEELEKLSHKKVQKLLFLLAQCLQRLHHQGIVHADLKPEHIMLLNRGDEYAFKLIDLDSGFLQDDVQEGMGEMEGDPVYLAPETFLRMTGEPVSLTGMVDTFAMGILIHQLWTGRLPKIDKDKHTYLYEAALAEGEIQISQSLPLGYRLLVERMLRRDPAERPVDEELVRLLAPIQEEELPKEHLKKTQPLNGLRRRFKSRYF